MNLMQLPDERNSKRQISEEKEQKKNGHKKYNLFLLPGAPFGRNNKGNIRSTARTPWRG